MEGDEKLIYIENISLIIYFLSCLWLHTWWIEKKEQTLILNYGKLKKKNFFKFLKIFLFFMTHLEIFINIYGEGYYGWKKERKGNVSEMLKYESLWENN